MSLYVCLVLAAELVVLAGAPGSERAAVATLWGAAIGLTLAHIFAFHLASRAVAGGRLDAHEWRAIWLQIAAAATVAAALSVPFFLLPKDAAITVDEYMIAGFVGAISYVTARVSGGTQLRAALFGAVMLSLALVVVLAKAALAMH